MTPKLVFLIRCGLPLSLAVGMVLCAWKMLQFRRRMHDFIDNPSWEATLRSYGAFDRAPIVFFGDSDMANWRAAPAFGALPIINRGRGGDQAAQALPRFERDALAFEPKVIALLMGSNDLAARRTPQQVAQDIEALVKKARDKGIRVIVCSVLPVSGAVMKLLTNEAIVTTNALLKAVAERQSATFVDLHSAVVGADGRFDPRYTVEGFHANPRGYFEMSKRLHPVLVKVYDEAGL